MDINPWYECEKWSKIEYKNICELSVPCERAHCKLQINVYRTFQTEVIAN